MRLFLFTMTLLSVSVGAFAASATPPASDAPTATAVHTGTVAPHAVSDSPAPLPGASTATEPLSPEQAGTLINLQDYQHWSGNDGSVERFTTFVIRDKEEWRLLWLRVGREPPIEFPRDKMAIAIMLGPRPSDGYNVRVTEMRILDDSLYVSYLESKPNMIRPGGLQKSSPWVIKFAPAVSGRVRFKPITASGSH